MLELLVQELMQALVLVLVAIATTAIAAVGRAAIGFIKAKMTTESYAFLKSGVATIVRFVEQSSAWDELLSDGVAKKERAIVLVSAWAKERGIPITSELLSQIIEEAVNVMNAELGGNS